MLPAVFVLPQVMTKGEASLKRPSYCLHRQLSAAEISVKIGTAVLEIIRNKQIDNNKKNVFSHKYRYSDVYAIIH